MFLLLALCQKHTDSRIPKAFWCKLKFIDWNRLIYLANGSWPLAIPVPNPLGPYTNNAISYLIIYCFRVDVFGWIFPFELLKGPTGCSLCQGYKTHRWKWKLKANSHVLPIDFQEILQRTHWIVFGEITTAAAAKKKFYSFSNNLIVKNIIHIFPIRNSFRKHFNQISFSNRLIFFGLPHKIKQCSLDWEVATKFMHQHISFIEFLAEPQNRSVVFILDMAQRLLPVCV